MGLFSSNKLRQPPLPDLAIQLDDTADRVYRPDDIVRGHVVLTPVASIEPEALKVSLFGQSLIWYRRDVGSGNTTDYHHWRDNAPLFEVAQDVLHAATTKTNEDKKKEPQAMSKFEAGQIYTFPFQFTFPAGTGTTRYGQYENDSDQKYDIGPHDLPPSFLFTRFNRPTDDGTDADFAKIEYGVRATLICPGIGVVQGKSLIDLTTTSIILFQPTSPIPPPGPYTTLNRYPKTLTLRSSLLAGNTQTGIRQSIRDRLSSSTPTLDFEVAIELPEHFTSGSEFHFRASFTTLSRSPNALHIPPSVTFNILKLDLLDFTFFRAPRDRDAGSGRSGLHRSNRYESWPPPDQLYIVAKNEHEDFTERKTSLNALPESAILELTAGLPEYSVIASSSGEKHSGAMEEKVKSTCEQWFTARIPGVTVPSFRSFAITRAYKVRVKLGVEVGGKKFEREAESAVGRMGSAQT